MALRDISKINESQTCNFRW